jgi:hypothetical protein
VEVDKSNTTLSKYEQGLIDIIQKEENIDSKLKNLTKKEI